MSLSPYATRVAVPFHHIELLTADKSESTETVTERYSTLLYTDMY